MTDARLWLENRRMSVNPFEWLEPVDYSFLRLAAFNEVEGEDPRTDSHCPRVDPESKRFIASTVRFNNNHITELPSLSATLDSLLFDRGMLTWLDLSFNAIAAIDANLTCLTSLRVLYFHANQLASLQEVAKLTMLPYLRALTLHGNPLEEGTPRYRTRVLLLLPGLRSLDFSAVTRRDRAIAQFNMLPKPRPRRIKDDDDDAAV
ncbi:leucine-rich repeat-containing protein 51-like [Pollicipes pollicipes]|uniref:leucine-rich repeat-containing protein 51-like n=1 Tax=Pollicipes pollicipes TaxID=41117 RepID=UPI0018858CB1|nr:leucine-rich repeat-containing protein 51-like [Pollicipes pollicipes]XP_037071558.1 leucine-rich repeat-containing protein 51-like [Pollicipes pollicipes]